MNHLLRDIAPVSAQAWEAIEEQSRSALKSFLAARKLVDFAGPLGWETSAVPLGRVTDLGGGPAEGVRAAARQVQPLVELRAELTLDRRELDAAGRGAPDPDLRPLVDAARQAALAEDRLVFGGYTDGAVKGITTESPHEALSISDDYEDYPSLVARAVQRLQESGIEGPYGLALGPVCWRGVVETTQRGGLIVFDHISRILGGPIVPASAVSGGVVMSLRGGDYVLTCGQDLSVGYLTHDAATVTLYLEESITFQVITPEAAVPLVYR